MKSGYFLKFGAGVLLSALPFYGWAVPEPAAPRGMTNNPPVEEAGTNAPDISTAPAKVVSTEITVPANIKLAAPVSEIVKLANSGVDQGVMLAYVTNSTSTFNLGADEIIYLKDIGIPGDVVTAMIQHDQELKGEGAVAATPTPALEAPAQPAPPAGPLEQEPAPQPAPAVEAPLTPPAGAEPAYSQFYGALAPYGAWINVEGYGLCWQPTAVVVNPAWSPYWDCGHWVYTDAGWYWYSDYSWGWAPFHYGRWFHHAYFGWCWAPDVVWGPAWVSWRYSDAYCGWAPLGPGVYFSVGIGFTYHGHYWHDWDRPWNHHFVAWGHFRDHDFHGHGVPHGEITQVYNNTKIVNNVVVRNNITINQGIPRNRVAAATHSDVRAVTLHATSNAQPLSGRVEQLDPASRRLTVYRPVMPASNARSGNSAAGSSGKEIRSPRGAASTASGSQPPRATAAPHLSSTGTANSSLKVIGRRDSTTPVDVVNRPAPAVARVQAPASTPRGTANAPAVRQNPSASHAATAQNTPAWSTPQRSAPATRNAPQVANRYEAPTANPAYNRPATASPAPVYQSPTRTVAPRYDRVPPSQGSAARPTAPASQTPARTAPEVPRYNPAPPYTPQRSYTPAPAPSYSRPEAPRYSAPAPAPAPARSAPAAPAQAPRTDNNSGRR